MIKKYFFLFVLFWIGWENASAARIVDCTIATKGTKECNPYTQRMIRIKEIKYDLNRNKLIVTKTLPSPEQKSHTRVITIDEMAEKYVKIEDSLRFKGTRKVHLSDLFQPEEECRAEQNISQENKQETTQNTAKKEETSLKYGEYTVIQGDTLGGIAKKFELTLQELSGLNGLGDKDAIKVGQKLQIPLSQNMIDTIVSGEYRIQAGDTLISIANKFNLSPKELSRFNDIKTTAALKTGKILQLPFSYIVAQLEAKQKKEAAVKAKEKREKTLREFGKNRLRVTATAYTSHASQTDKSPFIAAWGNRIGPGMKIIAVSRDLLARYGLNYGSKVKVGGLSGFYTVGDKMNKRFRKRIDIYMGVDKRRALQWGRRSVILHW